ncbi:GntR family transcriptional regulator [Kitasatospora sp. NPDC101157]|uniref:GntR family transcriptional regulator n=1 Tax=Kitasatospora sp. NPDC101157 TaxID=3364098 RepID=UPI0037F69879
MGRLLLEDLPGGRRQPGDRLVERRVAAELSVSRVPVREALRSLRTGRLLTAEPTRAPGCARSARPNCARSTRCGRRRRDAGRPVRRWPTNRWPTGSRLVTGVSHVKTGARRGAS